MSLTGSCGYCGYALNLSSSARDTAGIGSKYRKQIKKGVVAFVAVDESRFTLTDDITCMPYFRSRRAWGLLTQEALAPALPQVRRPHRRRLRGGGQGLRPLRRRRLLGRPARELGLRWQRQRQQRVEPEELRDQDQRAAAIVRQF
jgi:hypothetical protein